jgi:broad specificity phosphatase PhoE
MSALWLIRHGQTDWNVEGRWQGQIQTAPPLNQRGVAQAQALGPQLAGVPFAGLYSSDLLRARQTAEIVAGFTGLPVVFDPRLREVNLGIWEGMLGDEIALRFAEELGARRQDPIHSRPPQGETTLELAERVVAALTDISNAHSGGDSGGDAIVVTHGMAMAAAICRAHNLSLDMIFDHLPGNAVPVILDWPPNPSIILSC